MSIPFLSLFRCLSESLFCGFFGPLFRQSFLDGIMNTISRKNTPIFFPTPVLDPPLMDPAGPSQQPQSQPGPPLGSFSKSMMSRMERKERGIGESAQASQPSRTIMSSFRHFTLPVGSFQPRSVVGGGGYGKFSAGLVWTKLSPHESFRSPCPTEVVEPLILIHTISR